MPRAVLFLLAGALVLCAVTLLGFIELTESVLEGETGSLDSAVLAWMEARATERLDAIALEITALGDSVVLALVLLVASALLWTTAHRFSVLLLWVGMGGSGLLGLILKHAFGRPRPELRIDYVVSTPSFPSGHALGAVVAYLLLAWVITRLQAGRRLRRVTWTIALVLIVLIGLSRIYLGVHYPTDVVAGYSVGLAWAIACALAIEAVRLRSVREDSAGPSVRRAPSVGG